MLDIIEHHKQKNGALNRYNFFNKLIVEDLIIFCNTGQWVYPEEGYVYLQTQRENNFYQYKVIFDNLPEVV
jgi:hypothetical protein